MYIPRPQRGDASPACRSLLPGECLLLCQSQKSSFGKSLFIFPPLSFSLFQQKMDKNKDGVVTIDEFIDCCQNVSWISPPSLLHGRSWHTFSFSLRLFSLSLYTGWKHHAINAPLWKCSLTFGWLWKRTSSLARTWTHTVYSVLCRLSTVGKTSSITLGHVEGRSERCEHSGMICLLNMLLN